MPRRPKLRLKFLTAPAPISAKPEPAPNLLTPPLPVAERHRRIDALLAELCEKFPLTFRPRQVPPPWPALKIGIDRDILERIQVSRRLLKAALRYYTSRRSYRAGLVAGAVRVDLDGKPAGEVAVEHAFEAE
jgi:sRNA-binding protein